METIDEDWETMLRGYAGENSKLYQSNHKLDRRLGAHPISSKDPHHANPALDELFQTKPGYTRVLCVLYFLDFECFGYDFPQECREPVQQIRDYLGLA